MKPGDVAAMPADIRHQGYSPKRSMLLVWENGSPEPELRQRQGPPSTPSSLASRPKPPALLTVLRRAAGSSSGASSSTRSDGATIEVLNPHDCSVLAEVAEAGPPTSTGPSAAAAAGAFPAWAATAGGRAGPLLLRLADAIEAHADELAPLESTDTGHPLRDSPCSTCRARPRASATSAAWPTRSRAT